MVALMLLFICNSPLAATGKPIQSHWAYLHVRLDALGKVLAIPFIPEMY